MLLSIVERDSSLNNPALDDVDNAMTVIVNYEVIIYCRLISKAIGYFSQV